MTTRGMYGKSSPLRSGEATPAQLKAVRTLARVAKRSGQVKVFRVEWVLDSRAMHVCADDTWCLIRTDGTAIWMPLPPASSPPARRTLPPLYGIPRRSRQLA